jgi:1-hydroxy-2-isopentenylcarotenoid 3,4-desaturase
MSAARGERIVVVGAGIGGMAAAAQLAQAGFSVTVIERNDQTGGRARVWRQGGYTFDMGPSWYLMPEVFERFFAAFGKRTDGLLRAAAAGSVLSRLFWRRGGVRRAAGSRRGGGAVRPAGARRRPKLGRYLDDAAYKYRWRWASFSTASTARSFDFLNRRMMTEGLKLNVLGKLDAAVRGSSATAGRGRFSNMPWSFSAPRRTMRRRCMR